MPEKPISLDEIDLDQAEQEAQAACAVAHADYARAPGWLKAVQARIDRDRGAAVPYSDALDTVVTQASADWLAGHPGRGDPDARRAFVEGNIRSQVLKVLLHPNLEMVDHAEGLEKALDEAVREL